MNKTNHVPNDYQAATLTAYASDVLAHTNAAAIHLPISEGMSVYLGADAEIAKMLATSGAAGCGEPVAEQWHAPGMGEIHSHDHKYMIDCMREIDHPDQDFVADDELASKVCAILNSSARAADAPSDLPTAREMAIAQAVRQACVNTYSPDSSAHDWSEAMADINLSNVIRSAKSRVADALDSQPTELFDSSAPVTQELKPIPYTSIVKAIRAIDDEAKERGKMYPQNRDEQKEDRQAATRVIENIEWYATHGGAVAETLPGWPVHREAPDEEISLDDLATLLPGPYYMDPPDGGSVSVIEQLRRMSDDAAKFRAHTGWQSIDTAPKDGTEILLRSARGRIASGKFGQHDGWANPLCWVWPYVNLEPTHWMQISLAPASSQPTDGEVRNG